MDGSMNIRNLSICYECSQVFHFILFAERKLYKLHIFFQVELI